MQLFNKTGHIDLTIQLWERPAQAASRTMPAASSVNARRQMFFSEDVVVGTSGQQGIVTRVPSDIIDEEYEDMYEDAVEIPDGCAQVCWLGSMDPQVVPDEQLQVVDRCFLHGDIVALAEDSTGQSGTVAKINVSVDVRWCKTGRLLRHVNVHDLSRICPIKIGSYVVKGPWLGRVEECMDNVYVKFSDGGLCKVAEATLDDLEPVQDSPFLDETHAFYPGQTVTCHTHDHLGASASSRAFQKARW